MSYFFITCYTVLGRRSTQPRACPPGFKSRSRRAPPLVFQPLGRVSLGFLVVSTFRIACVFLHVERGRSSKRVWRSPRIIYYTACCVGCSQIHTCIPIRLLRVVVLSSQKLWCSSFRMGSQQAVEMGKRARSQRPEEMRTCVADSCFRRT
jgi:hypothetical protein